MRVEELLNVLHHIHITTHMINNNNMIYNMYYIVLFSKDVTAPSKHCMID